MSDPIHRVLVVDDDPTSLALLEAALMQSGYAVDVASDGATALACFRRRRYDLVMLDVDMPVLDGYQVCAQLRREAGMLLPIIMVTGMDDVDAAYRAGATDFLSKPVNWSLVGHRVRYLMRAYHTTVQLHAAQADNEALLRALPDVCFELDAEGRFVAFHAPRGGATTAFGGLPTGRQVDEVVPRAAAQVILLAIREAAEHGIARGREVELPAGSGSVWYELSVSRKEAAGAPQLHFVVLARDITQRRTADARIRRLAYYDALTGLANRAHFVGLASGAVEAAQRDDTQMAILCIDLDNFKRINDTLGHSVGDELLQLVAKRLRLAVQGGDGSAPAGVESGGLGLARLGGDEFMVLLPRLHSREHAADVAARIVQSVSQPMRLARHDVLVTPSIGIALFPGDGRDVDTLFRHADLAMYYSKRQGPGNHSYFKASMNSGALKRLTIESRLRGAISNGELELHYQPQFALRSGGLCGMEALVRWTNPELGAVPPGEFISVAEDTGLILPIGDWVLRTACAQAQAWIASGLPPVRVAVNVSGRQLEQWAFAEQVSEVLAETGLAAHLLELEITETQIMQSAGRTEDVIAGLKAVGVDIAIDDFGTGYSSLSRLRDFAVDRLKIDRAFVQRLVTSADDRAIVSAIIAMARILKLEVVAEGVEDMDQLMLLREADCALAQGYLLGRPQNVAEATNLMRRVDGSDPGTRTQRLERLVVQSAAAARASASR